VWRSALWCLVALLGACSALPPRPAPPVPRDLVAIAGLETWQASGRLAVRTDQDGFSAHFEWRQAPGDGELSVRGPFGAGAARIAIGADRIRIDSGSEAPLEIAAPYDALEPLLSARIGFPLPLESLRFWLLGIPAPGITVQPAGEGAFLQSGWRIAAHAFGPVAGAPGPLPGQVELTRGTTRIRVLVDRWRAGAP
jgi:outer membrane lipoprotein LolB